MRYRWAVVVVAIGLACVLAGHLWVRTRAVADADIGAAFFILFGWLLTAGGGVMLVLTLVLALSRPGRGRAGARPRRER